MGVHTTVTISTQTGEVRNDLAPVAVQIDTMSQQEGAYWGGSQPYYRYAVYVTSPNSLQDGDIEQRYLLTDTANLDPVTGTNKMYRVISDPEFFIDNHIELICDRYRGT